MPPEVSGRCLGPSRPMLKVKKNYSDPHNCKHRIIRTVPIRGWGGGGAIRATQLNLPTRLSIYFQDFRLTYKTFNLHTRLSTYLQGIHPRACKHFNSLTRLQLTHKPFNKLLCTNTTFNYACKQNTRL